MRRTPSALISVDCTGRHLCLHLKAYLDPVRYFSTLNLAASATDSFQRVPLELTLRRASNDGEKRLNVHNPEYKRDDAAKVAFR
jgi:hypothetical protein